MPDDAPSSDQLRSWLLPAAADRHFRVEGRHAVRALVESELEILALFDLTGAPDAGFAIPAGRVRHRFSGFDPALLADLVGFAFHRGVLAVALKPERRLADWVRDRDPATVRLVVLDRLADPGNVGTVIRNAAAFGFDAAVCSRAGASPYQAKAVRASATALFRLPVFVEDDWPATLARALPGTALVGTSPGPGAMPLDAFVREAPASLAAIFGGEADGLSPDILARCRHRVTIPISDRVESLNVASASAIVLHALRR